MANCQYLFSAASCCLFLRNVLRLNSSNNKPQMSVSFEHYSHCCCCCCCCYSAKQRTITTPPDTSSHRLLSSNGSYRPSIHPSTSHPCHGQCHAVVSTCLCELVLLLLLPWMVRRRFNALFLLVFLQIPCCFCCSHCFLRVGERVSVC